MQEPLGSHVRRVHGVTERFMGQARKGYRLIGMLTT